MLIERYSLFFEGKDIDPCAILWHKAIVKKRGRIFSPAFFYNSDFTICFLSMQSFCREPR